MSESTFRLMVVCTANICRSVMAEAFLRQESTARGLDIVVSSCGTLFDDEPASDPVIELLADRGIDVRAHRSRKFEPSMLDDADLVLTMERMHARDLVLAREGASKQVHTLGAICEWLGDPAHRVGSPWQRMAAFAETRRPVDLLGGGADEVDDPHGRSKRLHRRTAERLELLSTQLLDGLFRPSVD